MPSMRVSRECVFMDLSPRDGNLHVIELNPWRTISALTAAGARQRAPWLTSRLFLPPLLRGPATSRASEKLVRAQRCGRQFARRPPPRKLLRGNYNVPASASPARDGPEARTQYAKSPQK